MDYAFLAFKADPDGRPLVTVVTKADSLGSEGIQQMGWQEMGASGYAVHPSREAGKGSSGLYLNVSTSGKFAVVVATGESRKRRISGDMGKLLDAYVASPSVSNRHDVCADGGYSASKLSALLYRQFHEGQSFNAIIGDQSHVIYISNVNLVRPTILKPGIFLLTSESMKELPDKLLSLRNSFGRLALHWWNGGAQGETTENAVSLLLNSVHSSQKASVESRASVPSDRRIQSHSFCCQVEKAVTVSSSAIEEATGNVSAPITMQRHAARISNPLRSYKPKDQNTKLLPLATFGHPSTNSDQSLLDRIQEEVDTLLAEKPVNSFQTTMLRDLLMQCRNGQSLEEVKKIIQQAQQKRASSPTIASSKRKALKVHPKRKRKDPKRPRGYVSAFNFFCREQRKILLETHPELRGLSQKRNNAINCKVGRMWKSLTPSKRQEYEEKAKRDKVRYLQELARYTPSRGYKREAPRIRPPPGFAWDGLPIEEKTKLKEGCTHPNQESSDDEGSSSECWQSSSRAQGVPPPTQPRSAYVIFVQAHKKELQAEHPGISFAKMGKLLGERWRSMDKAKRARFETLAENDKKRYEKEMEQWRSDVDSLTKRLPTLTLVEQKA